MVKKSLKLTMEINHLLYLVIVYLFVHASGEREDSCSQPNSPCSTNEQCCSIPNGKSYCNLKTKRCETSRYCDESSPNDCPFNDLSADEIENVIKIIKKSKSFSLSSKLLFPIVRQQEPKKKLWNSGDNCAIERKAYAAVYDLQRNLLSEVIISLSRQSIVSVKGRNDSVPVMTLHDYRVANVLLHNDPRLKRAYERRGLNATYASLSIWAIGADADENFIGRRRGRLVAYYKDPDTRYVYWRPVEGLSATIDIDAKEIVDFIDKGNVPVPSPPCLSDNTDRITPSEHLSESAIHINGYHINWHKWKFQYSMDPIHGLQLYHIRYVADGEERFVIYKLSISEMFVPYGAGGDRWRWRGAFDAGEYGLGKNAVPLTLGIDVPMNAKLLSCPKLDDTSGEVSELKGCVAVYERDALPVYKHYNDAISAKDMVVTFVSTVGNYDYMFNFIFSMDGNIEILVSSTGLLLLRGVSNEQNDPNCIEDCKDYVNENAIAPVHQHFFNYRIDFDIDGANNMLTQVDFANDPIGPENPDGGAFSLRRTIIRKESFLDSSAPNGRFWSVINTQSRNKFNSPRGYSLQPGNLGYTFAKPGNPLNQAMFIAHPIWVTAYNDDEQGAAGTFPRSGKSGQGLPEYIENGESLDNADLVVWHTFAVNHAPRPEEFPIMNKMHAGFQIMSRNFQSANPNVKQCKLK